MLEEYREFKMHSSYQINKGLTALPFIACQCNVFSQPVSSFFSLTNSRATKLIVKLVHPSSVHVIPLPNDHRAEL
jgi:hypothetical protein